MFCFEGKRGVCLPRFANDIARVSDYFRALWVTKFTPGRWGPHVTPLKDYDASIKHHMQHVRARENPRRTRIRDDSEADDDTQDGSERLAPARPNFSETRYWIMPYSSSLAWRAVFEYLRKDSYPFRGIRSSAFGRSRKKASPRSVYRVAHLLGLEQLAQRALNAYARQISSRNFMQEVLHHASSAWPELRDAVMRTDDLTDDDNVLQDQLTHYEHDSAFSTANMSVMKSSSLLEPDADLQ